MSKQPKILVIDDDRDFRAAVRSVLELRGYQVSEAASGKEGLRKLVEEKPDLVTVDVMMTCDTDGYGVSHAIRHGNEYRDFHAVPIVMVSSIEESPDELFPMSPEVELIRPDIYMTKPLDFARFLNTVDRVIGAAART
jgi:CheY-like chemotaxis protein